MEAQKGIEAVEKGQRERILLHKVTLVTIVILVNHVTLVTQVTL